MFKGLESIKKNKFSPAASGFKSSKSIKPNKSLFQEQQVAENTHKTIKSNTPSTTSNESEHQNETPSSVTVNGSHIKDILGHAMDVYTQSTSLRVNIQGPLAYSSGNALQGPDFRSLMRSSPEASMLSAGPMNDLNEIFLKIITNVIGQRFQMWESTFYVPGSPWYPYFAFLPMPFAPLHPNVPAMLMNMGMQTNLLTNANSISNEIYNYTRSKNELMDIVSEDHVDGIASEISFFFGYWFQTQTIKNIFGKGVVPGFKPPFSMGGPVVGDGSGLPFR